MSKQPMTIFGKEKLSTELKHLKSIERPAVIKAIEEARGHGDLSENADYDAAKEKQGFIESRISEIEGKLAESEVVDPSRLTSDKIIFGATVKLIDAETDEEVIYQIVGEDEADVKQGKISIFSPLARALIGKSADDVIELKTPKGEKEYEVIAFEFK